MTDNFIDLEKVAESWKTRAGVTPEKTVKLFSRLAETLTSPLESSAFVKTITDAYMDLRVEKQRELSTSFGLEWASPIETQKEWDGHKANILSKSKRTKLSSLVENRYTQKDRPQKKIATLLSNNHQAQTLLDLHNNATKRQAETIAALLLSPERMEKQLQLKRSDTLTPTPS
ncbi:MAG: hypothetical protein FWF24_04540 [Alphaproteobacteria bacterium]|nr:hypothetical protein [Alphaproteobacteria bacterium]